MLDGHESNSDVVSRHMKHNDQSDYCSNWTKIEGPASALASPCLMNLKLFDIILEIEIDKVARYQLLHCILNKVMRFQMIIETVAMETYT